MHFIDRLASIVVRIDRRRLGIFPAGWGDQGLIDSVSRVPGPSEPVAEIDIVWGRKEENRGTRVLRGSFASPTRVELPLETRAVPVELVEPSTGTDRIVVLMPAWNDHGFETRRKMALRLVDRGIGSVLFDIPFYGGRRVIQPPDQAIRTVADFMLMGAGAIDEGRALLGALRHDYEVGISGYSMGANLAALVSAAVPFWVATSLHAASYSPAPVYLEGVLSKAVRWQSLGGEDARARLSTLLSQVSVLDLDPLPHHGSATLVAASKDGFVPPPATERLHRHWPGSSLSWVDAGHATLIGRHPDVLADAIVASFER